MGILDEFNTAYHIPFKNTTIHARCSGSGNRTLVFLHGYLENADVWDDFLPKIIPGFRMIRMDLPGQGRTGVVAAEHSMDLMGEAVMTTLDYFQVGKAVFIGHSMGGYAALACLAHAPERMEGLCLLQSSPFAATEEQQRLRRRELRIVGNGQLSLLCSLMTQRGFAPENQLRMQQQIAYIRQIAVSSPQDGVLAAIRGLISRPDRQHVLLNADLPVLYILSPLDVYMPFERCMAVASQLRNGTIVCLNHVGHHAFLEDPDAVATAINNWLLSY